MRDRGNGVDSVTALNYSWFSDSFVTIREEAEFLINKLTVFWKNANASCGIHDSWVCFALH